MITPTSPLPFLGFTLTLNANAVTEFSPQPFNNTKELIVFNSSATDTVYVAVVDITAGFPAAGALSGANASVVLPRTALTLNIGSEGERQPLATQAFWGADPGANLVLVAQAAAGAPAVAVYTTYVQCRGGGGR
jgi:hypothetical protein